MPGTAHVWVDGDVATAAFLNALPRGVMGYAIGSSTAQTGIGVFDVDLTGLSITWTAIASRIYRIEVWAMMKQVGAAGQPTLHITDAAGVLKCDAAATSAANDFVPLYALEIVTGLSGSVTRKARANAVGGGTVSVNPDSQSFRAPLMMVTDVGI